MPQQYWRAAKLGDAIPEKIAMAPTHAMKAVRKRGLLTLLEAAQQKWYATPADQTLLRDHTPTNMAKGVTAVVTHLESALTVGNPDALFRLMKKAREGLKEPRLLFRVEEKPFALVRFGNGSDYIQVFEGRHASPRGLRGALDKSGVLHLTRLGMLPESVAASLRDFLRPPQCGHRFTVNRLGSAAFVATR